MSSLADKKWYLLFATSAMQPKWDDLRKRNMLSRLSLLYHVVITCQKHFSSPGQSQYSSRHAIIRPYVVYMEWAIIYASDHIKYWALIQYKGHLSRYMDSYDKHKTVMRKSYLYYGNSYFAKASSLYNVLAPWRNKTNLIGKIDHIIFIDYHRSLQGCILKYHLLLIPHRVAALKECLGMQLILVKWKKLSGEYLEGPMT